MSAESTRASGVSRTCCAAVAAVRHRSWLSPFLGTSLATQGYGRHAFALQALRDGAADPLRAARGGGAVPRHGGVLRALPPSRLHAAQAGAVLLRDLRRRPAGARGAREPGAR